jgi:hypothetical protein
MRDVLQIKINEYWVNKVRHDHVGYWDTRYSWNYSITDLDGGSHGDWEDELYGPLTIQDLRDAIEHARAIDNSFNCLDCGVHTGDTDEYYMVHDNLWTEAHPNDDGMLCIGCLEERLGRMLTADDFPDYPVNTIFNKSERLLSRLTDGSVR